MNISVRKRSIQKVNIRRVLGIRMLPSLLPPSWWTMPAHVAVP